MKKYLHIERGHAKVIQNSYRCAGCWEHVTVGFDKDGDWLECETEGCNLPGLVSDRWVERQILNSEAEAITARKILQDSFEWLRVVNKKLTRAQALSELGF